MNQRYLLEKMAGKGGWTYAIIREIPPDRRAHFGVVRVRGSIDGYQLKGYNLMPIKGGHMFLPVRAEIRKKIGKEAGDSVHVVLYADNAPSDVPDELLACLKDDPKAHQNFQAFTKGEQKAFVDWIYSAKTDDTKVERIVKTVEMAGAGRSLWDR